MNGFFDSRFTHINDVRMLDEHLRADIGLARRDPATDSPSAVAPATPRPSLAATLRTSARAFALPLALSGTSLS